MPAPIPVYGNEDAYVYVEGFGSSAVVRGMVSASPGTDSTPLDDDSALDALEFEWGTYDIRTRRGVRSGVACHRWLLEGSVVTAKLLPAHAGAVLYVVAWDGTRGDESQTSELAIPITPLDGHVVAVET